jgi:hypothetical protein
MLGPLFVGAVKACLVADPDDIHHRAIRLSLGRGRITGADQDAVVAVVEAGETVVEVAWPNGRYVAADDSHVGPPQGQRLRDLGVGQSPPILPPTNGGNALACCGDLGELYWRLPSTVTCRGQPVDGVKAAVEPYEFPPSEPVD